ncbi:hypothetical protein COOONC_00836 [Cooperia oncophora]
MPCVPCSPNLLWAPLPCDAVVAVPLEHCRCLPCLPSIVASFSRGRRVGPSPLALPCVPCSHLLWIVTFAWKAVWVVPTQCLVTACPCSHLLWSSLYAWTAVWCRSPLQLATACLARHRTYCGAPVAVDGRVAIPHSHCPAVRAPILLCSPICVVEPRVGRPTSALPAAVLRIYCGVPFAVDAVMAVPISHCLCVPCCHPTVESLLHRGRLVVVPTQHCPAVPCSHLLWRVPFAVGRRCVVATSALPCVPCAPYYCGVLLCSWTPCVPSPTRIALACRAHHLCGGPVPCDAVVAAHSHCLRAVLPFYCGVPICVDALWPSPTRKLPACPCSPSTAGPFCRGDGPSRVRPSPLRIACSCSIYLESAVAVGRRVVRPTQHCTGCRAPILLWSPFGLWTPVWSSPLALPCLPCSHSTSGVPSCVDAWWPSPLAIACVRLPPSTGGVPFGRGRRVGHPHSAIACAAVLPSTAGVALLRRKPVWCVSHSALCTACLAPIYCGSPFVAVDARVVVPTQRCTACLILPIYCGALCMRDAACQSPLALPCVAVLPSSMLAAPIARRRVAVPLSIALPGRAPI